MLKLTSVIQWHRCNNIFQNIRGKQRRLLDKIFGVEVFKIINEPIAASLIYNLDIKKTRILLFLMGIFEFQKENGIKLLKVSMDTQHERGS